MDASTTLQALLGGGLIGLAATALFLCTGRIAGVSGIVGGLVPPRTGETAWRALFVAGLVAGGLIVGALAPEPFSGLASTPHSRLIAAGFLVGFGASLGSGCTSGHGVCGVGRLSPRSIVATLTFMIAGALTLYVIRHLMGAPGQ
jgi:uncharacterized membrane protein YedE/YeeE